MPSNSLIERTPAWLRWILCLSMGANAGLLVLLNTGRRAALAYELGTPPREGMRALGPEERARASMAPREPQAETTLARPQDRAPLDMRQLAELTEGVPLLVGDKLNPRLVRLLGLNDAQSACAAECTARYLRSVAQLRLVERVFSSADHMESAYSVRVPPSEAAATYKGYEHALQEALDCSQAGYLAEMLRNQTRGLSLNGGSAELTAYVIVSPQLRDGYGGHVSSSLVTYKVRSELADKASGYVTAQFEEMTKAQYDAKYDGLFESIPLPH